jgi:phosphomannomutase
VNCKNVSKGEIPVDAITHIFKAYDVRGKVGSELTADVANKIGKAFADWLPNEGAIAVGRDMRPDSGELADALIKGLQEQGRDVIDIGEVTSDMIYFAVGKQELAGGAMITASHNPGVYNGIKLCREIARPVGLESGLDQIRDNVLSENFKPAADKVGKISSQDITEDWVQHVLSFIDAEKLTDLKLAVDAGNGMAGKIFPELEPYVPWDVSEMYFELDGTFPNHEANPLKFETLTDLIKNITDNKLDGGIAFDGDGDRAFLIDETGVVLTGGTMSAMLADYFLKLHPGANIVYEIRNSRTVPRVVEEGGGTPVMVKAGHAYIKHAMAEYDAPFGGESSGHFYFRDNWYADSGLIGAVVGVYVASLSGQKLSELRKRYTYFVATPELNFIVEDKDAVVEALTEVFKSNDINMLDGVTVTIDKDTWFNVRPSNTEPVMRFNAEANTQEGLDNLVKQVSDIITSKQEHLTT